MQRITMDDLKKMILFEDEHWMVFDKPAGIVIHEGNKHWTDLSMNDYLELWWEKQGEHHETFKPAFGYRLDKDTSGVLIAAKTYDALQYLNQIIRERKIDKEYLTWVVGETPPEAEIDVNLEKGFDAKFGKSRVWVKKNGERTARTSFRTLKTVNHPLLGKISLLKVKIYT